VLGQASAPAQAPIAVSAGQQASEINATPRAGNPMAARPISGGTLRVLADGRTAVAADSDRDQVYVVDLPSATLTRVVKLMPGDEPGRVVEDGAGRVHVALRSGGAVATIDPRTGTLLARRALCPAPRGLTVDPATQTLHVACAGGELVSIDAAPATTTPSRTLHLDRDLRDVVVKGGRLFVSTFRSAQILTVDASGQLLGRATFMDNTPASVAWRMVDGPGEQTTLLHESASSDPLGTTPGAYGSSVTVGAVVISAFDTLEPDGGIYIGRALVPGIAADAAVSPDGTQMAVVSITAAVGDNARVQLLSTTAFNGLGFAASVAGPPPKSDGGLGDDPSALPTPDAFLPGNGEVVAVAYDPLGNVIVQSREPATLQILTQRVDPVVLSTESRFDVGHRLFHTATSAQVACVSCHPEGGEDGRVWNFVKLGARRTQSLRGGIMNTAPFHWGGDEADLNAIMVDVFAGRMSGGTVDASTVAALGAWLQQIPTIPVSAWSDDATIARGKAAFLAAGCATCHAGADFTNNVSVDVGTGQAFQVPQLHGLGFRAPYMHDGCAPTLLARFTLGTCGGDARHGTRSALGPNDFPALLAYLDTL